MKKYLIAAFLFAAVVSGLNASELSYLGVTPIFKDSSGGVGINLINTSSGSFAIDANNLQLELFYREKPSPSFDWGFTLAPLSSDSSITPDFVYDIKVRLFKGGSVIPSFAVGINILRISSLTSSPAFTFLDSGRIGISWEIENEERKSSFIYGGANLQPGGNQIGNRYFMGAFMGNLNLTIILQDQIRAIGIAYTFI